MTEAPTANVTLPIRQAFVVQLSAKTEGEKGQWAGRVEHIVSGQAAYFLSVEELLAFMTRVLHTVGAQSPEDT